MSNTMKKMFLTLAVLGGTFGLGAAAQAQDWTSDRFHDELEHRAYHRELEHREAHRFPIPRRQHERLHDELEHQAYHDRLEDREFHRSYRYGAPHQGMSHGHFDPPQAGYRYPSGGYRHGNDTRPRFSFSYGW